MVHVVTEQLCVLLCSPGARGLGAQEMGTGGDARGNRLRMSPRALGSGLTRWANRA